MSPLAREKRERDRERAGARPAPTVAPAKAGVQSCVSFCRLRRRFFFAFLPSPAKRERGRGRGCFLSTPAPLRRPCESRGPELRFFLSTSAKVSICPAGASCLRRGTFCSHAVLFTPPTPLEGGRSSTKMRPPGALRGFGTADYPPRLFP